MLKDVNADALECIQDTIEGFKEIWKLETNRLLKSLDKLPIDLYELEYVENKLAIINNIISLTANLTREIETHKRK